MLFPIALSLHLLCLVLLASGGVGSLWLHAALKRALPQGPAQAAALGRVSATFGLIASTSALGMLASGLLLMASRGWADWGQPWLMMKLALFTMLFLNGVLVAKPTGPRLAAGIASAARAGGSLECDAVLQPLSRMGRFHAVQVSGLVCLVLLGVFGPR